MHKLFGALCVALACSPAYAAPPRAVHGGPDTCYLQDPSGTASSGGSDTLVDSSASWPTNQWRGDTLILRAGSGTEESRTVKSNTATTLTVTAAWDTAPVSSDAYTIDTELRLHPNGPCGTYGGSSEPPDGFVANIVDGADSTDCSVGGGTASAHCQWDTETQAWTSTAGSGAGDITSVGDCTTGSCLSSEAANTVLAGPSAGGSAAAAMRALVAADLPNLDLPSGYVILAPSCGTQHPAGTPCETDWSVALSYLSSNFAGQACTMLVEPGRYQHASQVATGTGCDRLFLIGRGNALRLDERDVDDHAVTLEAPTDATGATLKLQVETYLTGVDIRMVNGQTDGLLADMATDGDAGVIRDVRVTGAAGPGASGVRLTGVTGRMHVVGVISNLVGGNADSATSALRLENKYAAEVQGGFYRLNKAGACTIYLSGDGSIQSVGRIAVDRVETAITDQPAYCLDTDGGSYAIVHHNAETDQRYFRLGKFLRVDGTCQASDHRLRLAVSRYAGFNPSSYGCLSVGTTLFGHQHLIIAGDPNSYTNFGGAAIPGFPGYSASCYDTCTAGYEFTYDGTSWVRSDGQHPWSGVHLKLTSPHTVATGGSYGDVSWDSAVEQVGSWWTSGATVTVPAGTTRVGFEFQTLWAFGHNDGTARRVRLVKNGSTYDGMPADRMVDDSVDQPFLRASGEIPVSGADTLKLQARNDSSSGHNIQDNQETYLRIWKVR